MATRPTQRRLSYAQRQVIDLLRQIQEVSYDEMAARLDIDRRTAIQAVRRLELQRRLIKIEGRGCLPNRYLLTDRLICWS